MVCITIQYNRNKIEELNEQESAKVSKTDGICSRWGNDFARC
jgi:hypothetical protein